MKKKGRRRRRSNPNRYPVLVVNPAKKRRRRRRSRSSGRRRRRRGRRVMRRRNPRETKWSGAFASTAIGLLSGAAAYGMGLGIGMIPATNMWQTVIQGGATVALSPLLAKYADSRLAAGFAAGNVPKIADNIRAMIALRDVGASDAATEGGAIMRLRQRPGADAGRVIEMRRRAATEAGAPTTLRNNMFGKTFKEAAAATVTVPGRQYGPNAWSYHRGHTFDAMGRRIVSAHSSRR